MLIGQFHPAVGGAERECQNLSRALLARGHEVTVLTNYCDGLPPREEVDGIPVLRKIRGWHVFEASYMLSVLLLLWRHRERFDHLICFGLYLYTAPAVLFCRLFGKRVFFRLECSGPPGDFCRIAKLASGRFIGRVARWAHGAIAISAEIENELAASGFAREKIIRIANSVDTARFSPAGDGAEPAAPCLCFVGRLDRQKGLDVLLDALAILRSRGTAFTACLAGDGPDRQQLVEQARRLGLEESVSFAGLRQDPAAVYRQASIFVLPSRNEGLPLALLEAMASGLGVVATGVGGVPELLNPGHAAPAPDDTFAVCPNGIMAHPGNPDELSAAIQFCIDNRAAARRFAANARRHMEQHYSLERNAARYLELLSAPLRHGRARPPA